MARIQFGLALPGGPRKPMGREPFMTAVRSHLSKVQGHFDSIWFIDHLQFEEKAQLEGWTALTYLAGLYPQFGYGHMVLCQSFRNPALLAKMGATFQYLSGGRFLLGLGAGWHEEEYKAYGYDFPSPGVRIEQLDETIRIIKALWTEEQATVQGKHYQVEQAYCEPKPRPVPPVMIGGKKPRMLRLIARHADWWNVSHVSLEHFRELLPVCESACQDVGRDPATLRKTWFGRCLCVPRGTNLKKIDVASHRAVNAIIGTPEQVVEQLQAFIELGVDYFMLANAGFPDGNSLELLVREVLPRINAGR